MTARAALPLIAIVAVFAGPVGPAVASELPLPPDVAEGEVDGPYEIVVGAQPTQVQSCTTRLSSEGVRHFYEQALPNAGWTITLLPWLAQIEQSEQAMERAVKEHPQEAADPAVRQQLQMAQQGFSALRQHMRGAVYAARGAQRVLLRFSPYGSETEVAIHRWEELPGVSPGLLGGAGEIAPVSPEAAASWPMTNPCCSGEAVPEELRKVPGSVPRYPNGRMVSTGAALGQGAEQGPEPTTETYLTSDTAEQALAFYREHMPYNGWAAMDVPASHFAQLEQSLGPMAAPVVDALLFRNERAICTITVTESRAPAVGAGPAAGAERTFITVDYIELGPDWLKQGGFRGLSPGAVQR